MNSPRITVITPTFNRASYLPETIESVLGQGYPNLEYIVLDDGSSDDTLDVLARYSGRLRVVSHPNMGEANTVNRGFALAQGDFIGVVNSDDPVLPGFLDQVVNYMAQRLELVAAYPDWYMIDSDSRRFGPVYQRDFDMLRMLTDGICLVGPGALIRRSALELVPGRDPEYRFVGDYAFWIALGLRGRIARVPRILATHRMHDDSATIKERGTEIARERALLIERLYEQKDLPDRVLACRSRALSTAYYIAGAQALRDSKSEGTAYFLRALRTSPTEFLRHPKRLANLASLVLPKSMREPLRRNARRTPGE